MNRFQFVADHRRRFGVKRLCSILGIARSIFCYWRRTAADRAARQAADARLAARIRAVHFESDGAYGVPRITAELRGDGWRVNHKRIARVMRSINPAGVRLRRRHRTAVPDPAAAKAPDLIGRDPLATPLQHPTPSLPPRTPQPDRLRNSVQNNINYADTSRITRVQDSGSRPRGGQHLDLNEQPATDGGSKQATLRPLDHPDFTGLEPEGRGGDPR